uniref:Cytosolic Fe-S cluster assembly factor NARFL isoform 1 n=1 Tax=Sus scrofa TaxID=9823 RepID=A0A480TZJ9_PIG
MTQSGPGHTSSGPPGACAEHAASIVSLASQTAAPGQQRLVVISVSPQSQASLAVRFQLNPTDTARKLTAFFKRIGAHYVFDTAFSRNFSLLESQREFVRRFRGQAGSQQALPVLTSACPGWICYAEKTHGRALLPHISTARSPQQVMGALVKDFFAQQQHLTPDKIYHVAVMPCHDKKLEASRPDFFSQEHQTRDVDCVITTGEVLKLLEEEGVSLSALEPAALDSLYVVTHGSGGQDACPVSGCPHLGAAQGTLFRGATVLPLLCHGFLLAGPASAPWSVSVPRDS